MKIPRLACPPNEPSEGDLFEDALTGKYIFYRFGQWQVVDADQVKMIVEMKDKNDQP